MKNAKKFLSILMILVVAMNGFYLTVSADTLLTDISTESGNWNDITSNGSGLKVAVASVWHWSGIDHGKIMTSTDGTTWTTQVSDHSNALRSIVYGDSKFVAVGEEGTILTSPDGITWTPRTSGTTDTLYSVVWSGSQFVAVGANGVILTSTDGITWTFIGGISSILRSIAYGDSKFVAVGEEGVVLTSPDGITWTPRTSGTTNSLFSILWNGSKFVVAGGQGTILTSNDGINWSVENSEMTDDLKPVAWDGNKFYIADYYEMRFIESSDGINWSAPIYPDITNTIMLTIREIRYVDNVLYMLGNNVITVLDAATPPIESADTTEISKRVEIHSQNRDVDAAPYLKIMQKALEAQDNTEKNKQLTNFNQIIEILGDNSYIVERGRIK